MWQEVQLLMFLLVLGDGVLRVLLYLYYLRIQQNLKALSTQRCVLLFYNSPGCLSSTVQNGVCFKLGGCFHIYLLKSQVHV